MADAAQLDTRPMPDFDAIAKGDVQAIANAVRLLWRDHDSIRDQLDGATAMTEARCDELAARLDAVHAPRAE